MKYSLIMGMSLVLLGACSAGKPSGDDTVTDIPGASTIAAPAFEADSAYAYIERLMEFGPRVPNTEAHRKSGDMLAGMLRDFGWNVSEQTMILKAFDGTDLQSRNIFAQINPEKGNRLLLLAHWDCRPWADEDPDPEKRAQPVPGANDGASGIGVLLEIARQLSLQQSDAAVDMLLVDAEDWGSHTDDDSWALGTRYFAENPPVAGYRPAGAILLDMVGSPDARFGYEYYSAQSNPALLQKVWNAAFRLGHDNYFHTGFGGAITDDHIELIKKGIPSIDIIDYRTEGATEGFDPVWHTTRDTMDNISPATLRAVGETLMMVLEN